jgi:purine-cytosine permease-like protein
MYPFNFTAGSWAAVVIYFIVSFFAMGFSVVDVIVGEKHDKLEAVAKKYADGRS